MALAKTYDTLNGRIRGETSPQQTNYLTDALRSVTSTVNSKAEQVNSYRYKPYGAQLAKTGAGVDPAFLWTGVSGSRATGRTFAEQYNTLRHFSSALGQWTSQDLLFPSQPAYVYAKANPVSWTDPSGMIPTVECCCKPVFVTFHAERCYGKGSGKKPECWWPVVSGIANADRDWRGHNLTVTLALTLLKPLGSGGDCDLQWTEDFWINGVLFYHSSSFEGSIQAGMWFECKTTASSLTQCDQSIVCKIKDSPGFSPYGRNPLTGQIERGPAVKTKRTINITMNSSRWCPKGTASGTWTQVLEWGAKGDIKVWSP